MHAYVCSLQTLWNANSFPSELIHSRHPSTALPRAGSDFPASHRDKLGPARRETAGFALCAPQPRTQGAKKRAEMP